MTRILLLATAFFFALAVSVRAEPVDVTAQAKAANAEFLLTATPPGTPAAICLVDTGVNANPDTTNVFSRLSLPGLDGTDKSPSLHGTQMAMLIGAQSNGFGMVGLFPSARILSVQANNPGQDVFAPTAYMRGIDECSDVWELHGIKVIVVPVASEVSLTDVEQMVLREVLGTARDRGINVVAAAGNFSGRAVGIPANAPSVLSVGSLDATAGSLCATSATGSLLLAPGCAIDGADPTTGHPLTSQAGTSAAAVIAASALAALRTWRPDLAPDAAEQLLSETAVATSAGRRLDLAATFTAAGLGSVVAPPPPAAPAPPPPTAKPRLPKPKFTVRLRKRTLTIRVSNRPAKMTVRTSVFAPGKNGKVRRTATRSRRASVIRIRTARWSRVVVRFTDPTGARQQSPSATRNRRR